MNYFQRDDELSEEGIIKDVESLNEGEVRWMDRSSFVEDYSGNYYLCLHYSLSNQPQSSEDIIVRKGPPGNGEKYDHSVYLTVGADSDQLFSQFFRRRKYQRFRRRDEESLLELEEAEEEIYLAQFEFDFQELKERLDRN